MAKKKKQTKKMAGRKRGGASMSCPKCKSDSQVLITRRESVRPPEVHRRRKCARGHEFTTIELVSDDAVERSR